MVNQRLESFDFHSIESLKQRLIDTEATRRQVAVAHLVEHPQSELLGDLAERLRDEEPNVVHLAVVALGRLGTPAAPELARALAADQPLEIRRAAASGLAEIGAAGEPIWEPLCHCLEDDDPTLRELAALALSRQGPEVSACLESVLRHPRAETRISALRALGWLGPSARSSVPACEACLHAEELELRLAAAAAVANITEDSDSALPILLSAASSEDAETRALAAEQLGQIRPPPETAITTLLNLLQDSDSTVVRHAVLGLGRSQSRASDVLRGLESALGHGEADVRKFGLMALASWGPDALDALPAVREIEQDPDASLVVLATETARRIAPQAEGSSSKPEI